MPWRPRSLAGVLAAGGMLAARRMVRVAGVVAGGWSIVVAVAVRSASESGDENACGGGEGQELRGPAEMRYVEVRHDLTPNRGDVHGRGTHDASAAVSDERYPQRTRAPIG